MEVIAMVREERAEMADFLDSLRPEQWAQPSLCRGWHIRDVAEYHHFEERSGCSTRSRSQQLRHRCADSGTPAEYASSPRTSTGREAEALSPR